MDISGTILPDRLTGTDQNDNIFGLGGDDYIEGRGGNDNIFGGAGRDILYSDRKGSSSSSEGVDTLNGGLNDDDLYGHLGSDELIGGAGNDLLWGTIYDSNVNHGIDTLTGGSGRDSFILGREYTDGLLAIQYYDRNPAASDGYAIITDFTQGEDVIVLPGAPYITEFVLSSQLEESDDADFLISYDPSTGDTEIFFSPRSGLAEGISDNLLAVVENVQLRNTDFDFAE